MDIHTPSPVLETLEGQEDKAQHLRYEALESQLSSILQTLEAATDLDTASGVVVSRMCHQLKMFRPPLGQPTEPSTRSKPTPSVRPKRTEGRDVPVRLRQESRESVLSTDSTSSTSSTGTTSLTPTEKPPRSGGSLGPSGMQDLLRCLDNRTVPRPEPYDVKNGRSLKHFLASFEEFCVQSFRGSQDSWVGELGKLLRGEAAQAFQAYRSVNDTYEAVKRKLLRWYKEGDHKRKTTSKKMFSKASIRPGEKVCYYVPRLQNLFELAYPTKSVQHSYTLLDKFLETIPRTYRKQIKSAQRTHRIAGRGKLKWSHILSLTAEMEEEMTEHEGDPADSRIHSFKAHEPTVTYAPRRSWYSPDQRPGVTSRKGKTNSRTIYNQSPRRDTGQPQECSWCHLIGHQRADCRRWLGLCLACGAPDHYLISCPTRRIPSSSPFSLPQHSKFTQYSPENVAVRPEVNPLSTRGETLGASSLHPDKFSDKVRGLPNPASCPQSLNL